jgi:chromosomal replication initiation ATPase DnaA
MPQGQQLPLPFAHQPGFDPADFVPDASNAEALAWLGRTEDWPDRRLLIWGAAGCGKTHALHVWAAASGATIIRGAALCAPPDLPPATALAIDDADQAPAETALLHRLNLARDQAIPVLLSSRLPPARWRIQLPDLASRLRAITAVRIGPAEEPLLTVLLARLVSDRQLTVDKTAQDWLLRHLPRSPAALRDAVAHLDRVAWRTGRRISRAMAIAEFPAAALDEHLETPDVFPLSTG